MVVNRAGNNTDIAGDGSPGGAGREGAGHRQDRRRGLRRGKRSALKLAEKRIVEIL